jgi:hypothetical protein
MMAESAGRCDPIHNDATNCHGVAFRLRNSGGEEADHIIQKGSGPLANTARRQGGKGHQ